MNPTGLYALLSTRTIEPRDQTIRRIGPYDTQTASQPSNVRDDNSGRVLAPSGSGCGRVGEAGVTALARGLGRICRVGHPRAALLSVASLQPHATMILPRATPADHMPRALSSSHILHPFSTIDRILPISFRLLPPENQASGGWN